MATNMTYSPQHWEAEKSTYLKMMEHWLFHFRMLKTASTSLSAMGPRHRDLMRKMANQIAGDPEEEYYLLETFNLL